MCSHQEARLQFYDVRVSRQVACVVVSPAIARVGILEIFTAVVA